MNTHDGKKLLAQDLEQPVEHTTAPKIFTFATEIACNVLYDSEIADVPYEQAPKTLDIPWEEHVNCSIADTDHAVVIRQTDADLLSSENEECAYTLPSITSLKSVDDGSGADLGTSSRNQPVAVSCNTAIHDGLAQYVTETSAKVASKAKYLEIISKLEIKLAAAEQRCRIATEQQTVDAMRTAELEPRDYPKEGQIRLIEKLAPNIHHGATHDLPSVLPGSEGEPKSAKKTLATDSKNPTTHMDQLEHQTGNDGASRTWKWTSENLDEGGKNAPSFLVW
ncbi:hypothetical protein RvY_01943 [Ramazzottius varieornatus]|uniref:Uncharacterized protein n=1 Tax=Ramazzottius varieornatus TaxID=947166 RepID=A0A1D1UT80_RAMVA|nr:hypothetical protein RvY_01943 [Ramazzottius varieornatus]